MKSKNTTIAATIFAAAFTIAAADAAPHREIQGRSGTNVVAKANHDSQRAAYRQTQGRTSTVAVMVDQAEDRAFVPRIAGRSGFHPKR